MKKTVLFAWILLMLLSGCTQKTRESQTSQTKENTLKSVSVLYDSAGVNPSELISIFDRVNKVIDSIGYPDAGYKLWIVQGDSVKDFRFMIEGYWPDQVIYDSIHNNKMYQDVWDAESKKILGKMKTISYNRFLLVR